MTNEASVTSYPDTLQRGDTISCYQIEDVLGYGGFAVTYLAADLNLDVDVAIKEYLPREIIHRDAHLQVSAKRPEFDEDYETGLSNFAREAKTLARFKHPNIVRVHQVIHQNNTAYIVMDYERGQELGEVLARYQSLSEKDLRAILFPIFDGVEEIHLHGLAHRDIKPSNIYLRDSGQPVLLDFGAARYTLSETTQQLTAVVTVGYTPIEQYNVSENDQGPWTDIYALAAVLFEAVTGEMPVDSITRASSTLTQSEDPLPSVREKAAPGYSDHFLEAIDWGLRMEAKDRPQSIAQWRDAFDGNFNPADEYESKPPVRRSKLKTHAKYPPPNKPELTTSRLIPEKEKILALDELSARIEPRHTDTYEADIESIPLNLDDTSRERNATWKPSRKLELEQQNGPELTRRRLQRPSPGLDQPGTAQPEFDRDPTEPPPLPPTARADSSNVTRLNPSKRAEPTPTQEIRNVLRRDIMKREPVAESGAHEEAPIESPAPTASDNRGRVSSLERGAAGQEHRYDPPLQPHLRSQASDDITFDESDWDYEPPPPPSKWRWLLPTIGLAAVVGISLVYVNNPEIFSRQSKGPDMTMDMAFSRAEEKLAQDALISPTGESALDYYQLILSSAPENARAKAAVLDIQARIKAQIVEFVNNNDLTEANRLLTQATRAGLQIESTPTDTGRTGASSNSGTATTTGSVVSIDTALSPYLTSKINEVEALVEAGKATEARSLYEEIDKYIPNPELSEKLRAKIDAIATDSIDDQAGLSGALLPLEQSNVISDASSLTAAADAGTNTAESNAIENSTPLASAGTTPERPEIAASLSQDLPAAPVDVSDVSGNSAFSSAPRRSFISASGDAARHLNQLRLAIERKNLNRVISLSDNLPAERTEFLRRMFQRHDRVDVIIDNVSESGATVTARLNVSMFNQRNDGSFYSAGKWDGVTLSARQSNGAWQNIKW
ncbi:hypothetical protein AB833_12740 [Chromatiales bacterium (ex Bugula neritina AB1)]|nr:hypothetical protein AB833_12740 [Chromatiales bacterium (ex Bugula neritina AB1)]